MADSIWIEWGEPTYGLKQCKQTRWWAPADGVRKFNPLIFGFSYCSPVPADTVPDKDYQEDTNAGNVGNDYSPITITAGEPSWSQSAYGVFIPIVFGADRLPGNVFWASPFEEQSFTADDKVYTYYTCNFAVGFCEGTIGAILRVWVGDKLVINNTQDVDVNGVVSPNSDGFVGAAQVDLLDEDSPFKQLPNADRTTTISAFNGSETQIPLGVMAEVEGYENTPAYRGLSYLLFENFIANGTIPSITVEVLSNATGLYPRLYWDLTSPKVTFDTVIDSYWLHYDPNYDRYLVRGRDTADSSKRGFVWIDGNTLEEISQLEMVTRHSLDQTQFNNSKGCLTPSGHIVMLTQVGNAGTVRIINGETGAIDDELGPGGGLSGHVIDEGFGAPAYGVVTPGRNPYTRLPQQVLCVTGSGNKSIGFATIDTKNRIKMRSTLNGLLTYTNHLMCPVVIGSTFAATKPSFVDGLSTEGSHVFFFSWTSSDKTKIAVQRATHYAANGRANVNNPDLDDITNGIPADQLGGSGYTHQVRWVALDPVDNCFVLQVVPQAGNALIVKWSPFTGQVLWRVPLGTLSSITPHINNHLIVGQKIGVYSSNKAYVINTADGTYEEVISSLGPQGLPTALSGRTFYNGADNSLTWLSSTSGKRLSKVFLERISRSTVTVSSIVETLLERIGITSDLLLIDDLTALSLDGYTINSRKSLRTIFSELAQVFLFDIYESDNRIVYRSRGSSSVATIPTSDLQMVDDDGWLKAGANEDFSRSRKINLTYRDIDREYSNGVQSVALPKYQDTPFDSDSAIDVTVPMVLDADRARLLSEILLYSKLVYQEQYQFTAAPKYLRLDPSDVITITSPGDDNITARVRVTEIGNDKTVKITASREDPDIYNDTVDLFGATGRYVRDEITPMDPRVDPLILQIPGRTQGEIAAATINHNLFVTLLNRKSTVPPSGAIVVSFDNGANQYVFNAPSAFPTWGFVEEPLIATSAWSSTDFTSDLTIKLIHTGELALEDAASLEEIIDDETINLAYCGGELIQFESVTSLGGNRYLLKNINRAKLGTESAVFGHRSGEPFVLLSGAAGTFDTAAILSKVIPRGPQIGRLAQVSIPSSNNPYQATPPDNWIGTNLRARAVTDLVATYGSTDLAMTWQRNSRYGNNEYPDDGAEAWVETEPEEYTLYLTTDIDSFEITDQTTYLRTVVVTTNQYTYDAAAQTADGFDRTTETLYVIISHSGSSFGEPFGLDRILKVPPQG